jgi:hypothetical protein
MRHAWNRGGNERKCSAGSETHLCFPRRPSEWCEAEWGKGERREEEGEDQRAQGGQARRERKRGGVGFTDETPDWA